MIIEDVDCVCDRKRGDERTDDGLRESEGEGEGEGVCEGEGK